jgi:hypothetical protein
LLEFLFFSISNVYASYNFDPVFDMSGKPVRFCKSYKIKFQAKEPDLNSNNYLSYSTWWFNKYDYLVKDNESKASNIIFEPKGFKCENERLIDEINPDAPMISNADILLKNAKLKIKFQKINESDEYKYLKVSYLGYYYLSYTADLISLSEFQNIISCFEDKNPNWCFEGKLMNDKQPNSEGIGFLPN